MRFIKNNLLLSSTVGLLILAIVAGLVYNIVNPGPAHVNDWGDLSTLGYDEPAVVYIYLDNCGACNAIKDDVYGYFETLDSQYDMYMIDGARVSGTPPQGIPTTVPAILVIRNGQIITAETNTQNVLGVFAQLAD